jgi:hypothetical protein
VVGEYEDVGEPGEGRVVGDDAAEAGLLLKVLLVVAVQVEAEWKGILGGGANCVESAALRPVRAVREKVVDQVYVEAGGVGRNRIVASVPFVGHVISSRLFVVLLVEAAGVVDFAGMVEVVLDHGGDEPAGLFGLAAEIEPGLEEVCIVEGGDALAQTRVVLAEPVDGRGYGLDNVPAVDLGVIPVEGGITESIVVVDELGGPDVLDDVADGAAATGGNPEPVVGRNGFQVAEEGVPFRAVEGAVEEVKDLGDAGRCCGCCHAAYYTASPEVLAVLHRRKVIDFSQRIG